MLEDWGFCKCLPQYVKGSFNIRRQETGFFYFMPNFYKNKFGQFFIIPITTTNNLAIVNIGRRYSISELEAYFKL